MPPHVMARNLFFKHPMLLDVFILFVSFSQNAWGAFSFFASFSMFFFKFLIVFKGVCPIQRVCKERRVPSQECLRVWVGWVGGGGGGLERSVFLNM